jgi:2,3-bisphosphoglycerate-independent phosphoglycerate mutase
MRGLGLSDALTDTDPQQVGKPPLPVQPMQPVAERTAQIANCFVQETRRLLSGCYPANMITLRGFAGMPKIPTFQELYGLHPAAIALHAMYRGVARLVGMEILPVEGSSLADEFATLEARWQDFDFFYLHVKKTDTCGESGDFGGKVKAIEEVDALLPRLLALNPDVVFVGGDHSSPAALSSHSWHPVPALLYAKHVRADGIAGFGERACLRGSLGVLPATSVMPLALANAGRITKYGA